MVAGKKERGTVSGRGRISHPCTLWRCTSWRRIAIGRSRPTLHSDGCPCCAPCRWEARLQLERGRERRGGKKGEPGGGVEGRSQEEGWREEGRKK